MTVAPAPTEVDEQQAWTEPARLEVIVGSVRDGRFAPVVANWFVRRASARSDLRVGVLDLAEKPPRFTERIGAADAVVVITPEYNHSYPGPLKSAIDALRPQWHAKPIGFVSYGGLSGGLRAVEALRLVFAELHAMTIRETVSLHNPWKPANDPTVDYPDSAATDALHRMIRQLLWWADALRTARKRTPYPA